MRQGVIMEKLLQEGYVYVLRKYWRNGMYGKNMDID